MSRLYGPYSGTLGTILEVDVAPATRVIQVRNDSPNDLLVAFGPADKPGVVTSTQGQWANAVPAWDHPILPAGPGSSGVGLAAGGAFDGRIYLLPITPPGGLAQTGTASTRNSIYVLAFESGDYIPAGSSLPRQHDVTSQSRVIAVPIAVPQSFAWFFTATTNAIAVFSLGHPTANQLTQQAAIVYLYWFNARLSGFSTGSSFASYQIEYFPADSGNLPISGFTPVVAHYGQLIASHGTLTTGTVDFASEEYLYPPQPKAIRLRWTGNPNTPANISVRVNITSAGGSAQMQMLFNLAADVDTSNTDSFPGSIGNATFQQFGGGSGDPLLY